MTTEQQSNNMEEEQTEEEGYNIAVIGIGAMGGGMARALLESPVSRCISVYDRDTSLVETFYQEARAVGKAPPAVVVAHDINNTYSLQDAISCFNDKNNKNNKTHFCILVLQTEAQCEETCFGSGTNNNENNNNNSNCCLLTLLSPGCTVLLTSTVTATWAKRASQKFFLASGTNKGIIHFVDCPMSGGPVRARNGELTIMASMDWYYNCNNHEDDIDNVNKQQQRDDDDTLANCPARKILEALGGGQQGQVHWIKGGAGMGSTVKMVHQLLAGVHIVAAAEALALAAKAGLDVTQVYDIVNGAAGASWMFHDRGTRMLKSGNDDNDENDKDKNVPVVKSQMQIFVKDLDIVYAEAKRLQSPIPLASSALQQFISAQSLGLGQQDDSQVVKVYEAITGVPVAARSSSSIGAKTNNKREIGSNVGDYWKMPNGSLEEILEVAMEPRHLLVLSNPYTRVLRVEFPSLDTTLAHRHDEDSLYFFLVPGGASIINHVQGHAPKCDYVDFGEVRYGTHNKMNGGEPLIHKITNTTMDNKNLLCIDAEILKQPPITAAIPLVSDKHELIKTRDKCRIYQLVLQPGETVTVTYPFFHLTIVVQTGTIEKMKRSAGEAGGAGNHGLTWKENQVMGAVAWNEPTFDLTKTNVGETTYTEYIAEWR